MLYNIVEGMWDEELLRLLKIPASMMPEVCWSSETIGEVTTTLGLGAVKLAGIAGDQQAALFGQLCIDPGDAKNTYGTGCFLLEHIGDDLRCRQQRLITTLAAARTRSWSMRWRAVSLWAARWCSGCATTWGLFRTSSDVEALAASVEDTDGVVFVPAFTGLGAPHWDPYASGIVDRHRASTQTGHIARAAIESIAFQVADVVEAMERIPDSRSRNCAWMAARGERYADAVPGGPAAASGDAAGGDRDYRHGRGVSGGAGGELLERHGRDRAAARPDTSFEPKAAAKRWKLGRRVAGCGEACGRLEPATGLMR